MKFKNKYIKMIVVSGIVNFKIMFSDRYTNRYNKDLTEYIDPEFNYEEVIRCLNLHQN